MTCRCSMLPAHPRKTPASPGRQGGSLFGGRARRCKPVVFLRDVLVGVIRQQRRRHDAEDPAKKDIEGDRKARIKGGKQRCRDKRRWATGDNRGELVAER